MRENRRRREQFFKTEEGCPCLNRPQEGSQGGGKSGQGGCQLTVISGEMAIEVRKTQEGLQLLS